MRGAERRYVATGLVLAAAGAVAVAPVAPRPAEAPVAADPAVRLTSGEDSLLNIPINLFYDIASIPDNFVNDGLDTLARSLLYTGTWWVPSATNLWGTDPADPGHYEAVIRTLLPIPELSHPLADQVIGTVAAELPVSDWCDAEGCVPTDPASPITGMTLVDMVIWSEMVVTGLEEFPLFDNWQQVPLTELLDGYTFDPDAPGSTNPAGEAYPGFGFPGTHGDENYMPWVGDTGDSGTSGIEDGTFTLDPTQPIEEYFDSLTAPLPTDGFLGTGIEILTFEELARTLQAVIAGLVIDFYPFTPGSPFCPGDCSLVTELGLDYPDIVKAINGIWPGNGYIEEWLQSYEDGTYNGPTDEEIQHSIDNLHQGFWDYDSPSPPSDWAVLFDPTELVPFFHDLWEALGLNPPDLADAAEPAADAAATDIAGDLASLF